MENKTKIKIGCFAVAIIFIIVIFYLAANRNSGKIEYKNFNNSTVNNTGSVLTGTLSVTPEPPVIPAVTLNPALLSCSEISLGNKERKEIAFTFDAGAGSGSTDKILDILEENNIKVAFFLTGKWAEQNPELVKKISGAGHEIYNHTYSHPDLTKTAEEEIQSQLDKTENIIKNLTGKSTKPFFRPPYGARNKIMLDFICGGGYKSIYWTVDALDWKEGTTADVAKSRIFAKEQNGEIILMHVGDNLSAEILPDVIKRFNNDGYKMVSLSKLVGN